MKRIVFLIGAIILLISNSFAAELSSASYSHLPALVYPIVKPKVTSKFGLRKHPILRVVKHHSGIDLAVPKGSLVRAVADGVVVFSDPFKGYGNLIVIQHKNGYTSHYGHLEKILVYPGKKVSAGEIIGTVGSTGLATGPHLHLEIRKNGKPLNPLLIFPSLTSKSKG
ncbi:MAG: M23 family metallopeptidase [Candidatus Dadabacteria bacterium]|nr:MAG: M23 family metallopeptidase [Candidatus Dadabacteria bacterium]